MNMGSLFRTANAFGAGFVFTIDAHYKVREAGLADTSKTHKSVPQYDWDSLEEMVLPRGCQLVGVELIEGAEELPRFRHPQRAAYVLGPERGSVSSDLLSMCDEVVQIPTEFCINVALAGALIMYDRLLSSGRFGDRPVVPQGYNPLPHDMDWQKLRDR